MERKILKPMSCGTCPAVEFDKGTLICRCDRKLKAFSNNDQERLAMYNNCPLEWDEAKKEQYNDKRR